MKKIILLLIALLTFSGCLGIGDDPLPEVDLTSYSTSLFTISKPLEWQILEETDFTSNVSDQVLVAFRNNLRNEIFTANLSITASKLNDGVGVSDFTNSQRAKIRATLIGYLESEISDRAVAAGDLNIPAQLVTFQGKRRANDPVVEFKQLTTVRDGIGYLILASYLPSESPSTLDYLDSMINSFSLK